MKLTAMVLSGLLCIGTGIAVAQDAQAEKTIIANERAVNDAFAKGDPAAFKALVAADGWAVDSVMGRAPVADMLKDFAGLDEGAQDHLVGHHREQDRVG